MRAAIRKKKKKKKVKHLTKSNSRDSTAAWAGNRLRGSRRNHVVTMIGRARARACVYLCFRPTHTHTHTSLPHVRSQRCHTDKKILLHRENMSVVSSLPGAGILSVVALKRFILFSFPLFLILFLSRSLSFFTALSLHFIFLPSCVWFYLIFHFIHLQTHSFSLHLSLTHTLALARTHSRYHATMRGRTTYLSSFYSSPLERYGNRINCSEMRWAFIFL